MDPLNDKAHSNYANMLGADGRMDEALEAYNAALRVAPRNPTTIKNYGTLLYRAHRKEEAIAAVQRAVQIDPLNPVWVAVVERVHHLCVL